MRYWEDINDRLQMSEVVRNCGLEIHRGGFVCCPFHIEKTPSMKIYDKSYYCFGCHAHGKAIDFIQNYYNLQFKDACRKLNADFRLGLDAEIDPVMNPVQRQILAAKIESERIRREEAKRIERIENGHIECSDIDSKYEDLLYYTVVECPLSELLKQNGLEDWIDHSNYDITKPNVRKVFKYDLVGTPDFDDLVLEYMGKAHQLWKTTLLNKQIREEEESL